MTEIWVPWKAEEGIVDIFKMNCTRNVFGARLSDPIGLYGQ